MNLADIKTFDQLLPWLSTNLNWPMDEIEIAEETAFDDLTFEYEAKELGLKQDDIAHVREIRQLRPLVTGQPWGIFFVNFEDKKIPVGVLKRILGGLTIKKRQSANKAEQKAWTLHDLLFISASGNSGARELSFLHFAEENGGKNKTVLKELGWDKDDTQAKLNFVEDTLKKKLVWPDDARDADHWRKQWAAAFTTTHGAPINTAKQLTKRLAELAGAIRKAVGEVLACESKDGGLTQTYEKFKQTIFHNLTHADFADMYAQTVSYGLLAKQIERALQGLDTKALSVDDVTMVQNVLQPFLGDMLKEFLAIGGNSNAMNYNELGVDEVRELLNASDMKAVLLDFGNKNPHEDPVLHFYEHFLKDYDSIMREQRGVYYTPLPVVRFIVRSVHEILQKEFGLADGLADITTWGEMIAKHPEMQLPEGVELSAHFVQILDPATGTGTFLVEVIDQIEKHLKTKWKKASKSEAEILRLWNAYVPAHLLPRLNGFELMMAPYAIAHIKLGMKLHETGYRPTSKPSPSGRGLGEGIPRVRVYLTNTLDKTSDSNRQAEMTFITSSLAEESKGADLLKGKTPVTVVIGNPPYSLQSSNLKPEHRELVEKYKYVGASKIKEKNALQLEKNLNDDYVKFIAIAQNFIERNSCGILGIISNHSYIDNPTLRGMRHNLISRYSKIYLLDIHGNATKKEVPPHGISDSNIFNIRQGVAILLACKNGGASATECQFSEIWGTKKEKEEQLIKLSYSNIHYQQLPIDPPNYLFIPKQEDASYNSWAKLTDIFPVNGAGWISARDNLVVDFDRDELNSRIERFKSASGSKKVVLDTFDISDKKGWSYEKTKLALQSIDVPAAISECYYRPFDIRYIFFDSSLVWGCSWPTLQHIFKKKNLCLLSTRITKDKWQVLACNLAASHKAMSAYDSNVVFPLYLYDNVIGGESRNYNLSDRYINECREIVGIEQGSPENLFSYIYAIMQSPSYAHKYSDDLKSDFPRIPLPGNADLFRELVALGKQLVALHLLDEKQVKPLAAPETRYISKGEARVEKSYPQYQNGKVMINASCWFEDVPPEVWNFHIGGYQVCEKWLKDRAGKGGKNPSPGRVLTDADILHYRRVTIALAETIRLMAEVDAVIESHGGFPDAFAKAIDKTGAAA